MLEPFPRGFVLNGADQDGLIANIGRFNALGTGTHRGPGADPGSSRQRSQHDPTLEHLIDAECIELGRAKSPEAVMPMVTPIGRKALDEFKAERGCL